ncbi:MAG TPA: ScyD/ScyE family protein [Pyrinomonadaceae bacterium]
MSRLTSLTILAALALAAWGAPRAPKGGEVRLAYADLVKLVDGTVCKDRKSWGGKCAPEPVKVQAEGGGGELVAKCPGCLSGLKVKGARVTGKLLTTQPGGEVDFVTDAPSAADLAENVVAKLGAYFDSHFFAKAARPRGLATDGKGNLLVADFGTGKNDGRVWLIDLKQPAAKGLTATPAEGKPLADGLPSAAFMTDFQGQPFKAVVGLAAVRAEGATLYGVVNRLYGKGDTPVPGLENIPVASLLRIDAGGAPARSDAPASANRLAADTAAARFTPVASLLDFETRNDPDKDGVECNPFDLALRGGYVYVTDSGGNSVVRVDPRTGRETLYAVFAEIPNPRQAETGKRTIDPVPSGMEFGPDGALYVAYVSGFPFAQGNAGVYRLADANGDGDALDPGEMTVAVSGLTMASDVTLDAKGQMYTSENSLDFFKQAPGRICKIRDGKCAVTLTDRAVSPTGIVVVGEHLYYAQEFMGLVGRVALR